jgi:hypothetical protein
MKNEIAAGHSAEGGRGVVQIGLNELVAAGDRGQVVGAASRQVVEHAHAVAAGNERLDQVRADESAAAGDERSGHGSHRNATRAFPTAIANAPSGA